MINVSSSFKMEFGKNIEIQKMDRTYTIHFDEGFVLRHPDLPNFLVRRKHETDHMYFSRINMRCKVTFSA